MRITTTELLRLRLSAQRIDPVEQLSVLEVARHLLATQAQDFVQAGWALGLRAPGSGVADVSTALDSGALIRSAPFRGTLHFVAAEDIGWVLGITSARTVRGAATRFRQLELDAATLDRAELLTRDLLAGRNALTRDEYFTALNAAGIATTAQRGYNLIWYLVQTAVVCWGPTRGTQQGLVLVDEWITAPRHIEGDEALCELALRYFTGHAPATIADFAWWSKVTLKDARAGHALAASELTELEYNGDAYWAATSELARAAGVRMSTTVHALPGFDEYLLGYQDRSMALTPEQFARIVPGKNGIFLPMIVAGGEIIGTWKRTEKAAGVTVKPEPFVDLTVEQQESFHTSAAAFGRFRTTSP